MLLYSFSDGVGPQNLVGFPGSDPPPLSIFGTDSSGNIVSWNFEAISFLLGGRETKGIRLKMTPTMSIEPT